MIRILLKRATATVAAMLAIATVCLEASAALQIYKVKGNVTLAKGKMNVAANRRAYVNPTDKLSIPAGAAIEILDTETHRIFSSTSTGSVTVADLIKQAESHAADITRNINRKVISAVAENAGQQKTGFEALGMTIHETDAIATPPIELPKGLSYLAYLLRTANDPDSTHQSYVSLQTVPADADDDGPDAAFNFVLHNSMRQPLYFNVIGRDYKEGIRLYFSENPIASPKTDTTVTEYTFTPDPEINAYIAIASDVDFSIDDVKKLLKAGYNPDDDYYLTILTLK